MPYLGVNISDETYFLSEMFDDTNSIITIRQLEGSYTMAKGKKDKKTNNSP
jgi:hypothetical protein